MSKMKANCRELLNSTTLNQIISLFELSVLEFSAQSVSKWFGNGFQIKWKRFPKNGNRFQKMDTVSKKWIPYPKNGYGIQTKWKRLFPIWILLGGIQNGLVTAFSREEYVVCSVLWNNFLLWQLAHQMSNWATFRHILMKNSQVTGSPYLEII